MFIPIVYIKKYFKYIVLKCQYVAWTSEYIRKIRENLSQPQWLESKEKKIIVKFFASHLEQWKFASYLSLFSYLKKVSNQKCTEFCILLRIGVVKCRRWRTRTLNTVVLGTNPSEGWLFHLFFKQIRTLKEQKWKSQQRKITYFHITPNIYQNYSFLSAIQLFYFKKTCVW